MSQLGQTQKSAFRAHRVRFAPGNGLKSDIPACPKSACAAILARPASALTSRCTHQPAEDLCGDPPKMTKADHKGASREFRTLLVHILGMRG